MLDSCTSKLYSAVFMYSGKMESKEFCHVFKQLQKPLIGKFSQVTNTSKWFVLAFPELNIQVFLGMRLKFSTSQFLLEAKCCVFKRRTKAWHLTCSEVQSYLQVTKKKMFSTISPSVRLLWLLLVYIRPLVLF